MVALGYKELPEVVEKIDRIVRERRGANTAETYSRAKFIREVVNRALADLDALPEPKIRVRRREPWQQ